MSDVSAVSSSGYAVAINGSYWRTVDGPGPVEGKPDFIYPDYSTETYLAIEDGPPPEVVPPTPTPEEILASARIERDRRLAYATLRIDPLQDDVDLDEAIPEGIALLKAWKQYRSAASKVENKPGWPDSPQWPEPPVPLETSV